MDNHFSSNGRTIVALIDMDGTLIDCENSNRAAVEAVALKYWPEGVEVPRPLIDWSLNTGKPETVIYGWLCEQSPAFRQSLADKGVSIERMVAECQDEYRKRFSGHIARPGVEEAFGYLKQEKAPAIVVTNADHAMAHEKLVAVDLWKHLDKTTISDGVVGKDDVIAKGLKPKGAPDPYLLAADQMGLKEGDSAIIIEDSRTGLNAAVAAREELAKRGITVIVIHVHDDADALDPRANLGAYGQDKGAFLRAVQDAVAMLRGEMPIPPPKVAGVDLPQGWNGPA